MAPTKDQAEFQDTPEGWASRLTVEFAAARKELEPWQKRGDEIVKRFVDKRDGKTAQDTRLNLFTANVQTLRSMLYGQTPKVEVTRRYADTNDDVARVSAEMLERILNADIEKDSDPYCVALQYALSDFLLPGLGNVRARYEVEFQTIPGQPAIKGQCPMCGGTGGGCMDCGDTGEVEMAPEVPEQEAKKAGSERVATEYFYWKDQLWSPSRTFTEVRWWAFKAYMTREMLHERFDPVDPKIAEDVPLNAKTGKGKRSGGDSMEADPWGRCEVWEVWDKETRKVRWYVEGHPKVLDTKEDPLGLEGFWPFPRPMVANLTTSSFVPTPDYTLAQDLYNACDDLSSRISTLEDAVRVVGVYDESSVGVQRMLQDGVENTLIPVSNWAMFAEKGGVRGQVDWLPLDQIVNALDKLKAGLVEKMGLLYQITGMSDIMRGQASGQATATEQAIKARFASVRVRALQDEFARFATDVQKIKAEIIAKHFDPQSILTLSNAQFTYDAALAPQAAELIKSDFFDHRVMVKPEAVSLADYAALKQERTEFLTAFATFMQSAAPLMQQAPQSAPFLLEILKWTLSGFQGGSTIESVLDQAISLTRQQGMGGQGPPKPDPKLLSIQAKNQGDLRKTQADLQADLVRINAETKAEVTKQQAQAQFNIQETAAQTRSKMLADLARPGRGVP